MQWCLSRASNEALQQCVQRQKGSTDLSDFSLNRWLDDAAIQQGENRVSCQVTVDVSSTGCQNLWCLDQHRESLTAQVRKQTSITMKLSQGVGHVRLSVNPPQEHLWSGQVFSDDCQINSTLSVVSHPGRSLQNSAAEALVTTRLKGYQGDRSCFPSNRCPVGRDRLWPIPFWPS